MEKAPGALVNSRQLALESLALQLMNSVPFAQQKQASEKLLHAQPITASADGRKTLPFALEAIGFFAAISAANRSDPSNPLAAWMLTAQHALSGPQVLNSGFGFDNPDCVYQQLAVNGSARYEIVFRAQEPGPKMFNIYLYGALPRDAEDKGNVDAAVAGLRESEVRRAPDGSFTVTVDGEPANGRANHLRSTRDCHVILIRSILEDWVQQHPFAIEVRRIDDKEEPKLDSDALGRMAAKILKGTTHMLLGMLRDDFGGVAKPNTVSPPFSRGGGWGYSARGTFKLGDEEVLLVTVATPPDQYLGFQITDPWAHAVESVCANGSLNNRQAEANSDGSYTYVIALKDPGVPNWLDTGGLHDGEFLIRWQDLPESFRACAVRRVERLPLTDLQQLIPTGTRHVMPEERKAQLLARTQAYANRLV